MRAIHHASMGFSCGLTLSAVDRWHTGNVRCAVLRIPVGITARGARGRLLWELIYRFSEGTMLRYRKVTTWPRLQTVLGEKLFSEVPLVISFSTAQRTAFS